MRDWSDGSLYSWSHATIRTYLPILTECRSPPFRERRRTACRSAHKLREKAVWNECCVQCFKALHGSGEAAKMTIPARPNRARGTIIELTIIAAVCAASWFLSRELNIIEWVYQVTQTYNWFDDVLVVNVVLAVCLGVFSARRCHELGVQIGKSHKLQEELVHNTFHDLLTQLPNRRFLMDRLTQCVRRAKRHQDYKFAVVLLDIDQFKIVNDSLGHPAGDQLLIQIAERLTGSIRQDDTDGHPADVIGPSRPVGNDILASYGGDEFAIVLDDIRDASDGIRVVERIQRNLLASFFVSGCQLQITVSSGIAVSATDYSVAEDVLRDADTAMPQAKGLGKSRYQMCDPVMHAAAVNRLKLEDDLRQAPGRGELKVYYQPIVFLKDARLSGFEALIRWQRPGFGLVNPGEFISIAEETGLIVPIGSWVLREACRQMKSWHLQYPSEESLTIAVNFSAKQFNQSDLIKQVIQTLQETHLDPGSLGIEVTESAAMQETERTVLVLAELRAVGIRTSIDDFGTGYSSLSQLRRLPLNILKLDRCFMSEMLNNNESR